MKNKNTFAYYLNKFLTVYIPSLKNYSSRTFEEYCRVFTIFLRFIAFTQPKKARRFNLEDFSKDCIEDFLIYLKDERGNCNRTINQRLAAINSFCNFVIFESPIEMYELQRIMDIPYRKVEFGEMSYTTAEGIRLILNQINQDSTKGFRDFTMFAFMFDTGARVSEVCDMTPQHLRLTNPDITIIHGKGNKTRIVPLQIEEAKRLKKYMKINSLDSPKKMDNPLFPNNRGAKLTRQSINRILKEYVNKARSINPMLIPDKFSSHSIRHSSAMALLNSGVNMIYIRDILGHSSVSTTEIYLHADSLQKREAIKAVLDIEEDTTIIKKWKSPGILDWLNSQKY